ncbi:hypothetical protein QAD02_018428 [Eretmocerus hayati]|uniref:Uncharacterized protein n=1 Tax=Eretmocerus hayati TaxID=131215 RepID=A0ACC2PHZ9_9HYME|nr:hypothetical protein QAD02_018428 [Eretmocerus hayati]
MLSRFLCEGVFVYIVYLSQPVEVAPLTAVTIMPKDLPREDPVPIIPERGELFAKPGVAEDEHAPVDAEPNELPEIEIAEDEHRFDVVEGDRPAPEVADNEPAQFDVRIEQGRKWNPGDGVHQDPPRARGRDAPEDHDEGVGVRIHNPDLVPEALEAVILRVLHEQRVLNAPQAQALPEEQEELDNMGVNPEAWNNLPPMVFPATLRECHELIARQRAVRIFILLYENI